MQKPKEEEKKEPVDTIEAKENELREKDQVKD